jgi:GT2 family glycosyltransferase
MSVSQPSSPARPAVGLVAIGRNEGQRLRRCLASVRGLGLTVVYVDSGSSDGSVELARDLGAQVHELDLARPFTAARARNAGLATLLRHAPATQLVQFVDGDCELVPGWLDRATNELERHPCLAAVCGRRRERFPEASLYNRLCDLEWDTPVGDALECGGDVLMRVDALAEVGGYDPDLIAGEEPELCVRLRERGWGVRRIDADMTLHDAAMERFGQWWRRAERCGHTYAAAFARYGTKREARYARAVASVLLWALGFPAVLGTAIALAAGAGSTRWALLGALVLLAGYARLVATIARHRAAGGGRRRDAWLYAAACVLGKWPELAGMALYLRNRALGRQTRLIEYKRAHPGATVPTLAPPERRAG